jgi:hypothetical protein
MTTKKNKRPPKVSAIPADWAGEYIPELSLPGVVSVYACYPGYAEQFRGIPNIHEARMQRESVPEQEQQPEKPIP